MKRLDILVQVSEDNEKGGYICTTRIFNKTKKELMLSAQEFLDKLIRIDMQDDKKTHKTD